MKDKVLEFWFSKLTPADWFKKDETLDRDIKSQFLETYYQAIKGELYTWRETPEGRVAEIIVLDQFSRNIFRNDKRAFAYDCMAVTLSQEACIRDDIDTLPAEKKAFAFMPLMHSESLLVHELAVQMFSKPGMENYLGFEHKHKIIIERFGRYPHRNEILDRESTKEELEFLQGPNSSF